MASLTEPLQGGPYPDPDDDADIPNDLKSIVDWAAERSVMRFTNTTERDALLPSPTEGMVCVTGVGTAMTLWIYENAAWRILRQPGGTAVKRTWLTGSNVMVATASGVSTSSVWGIIDEDEEGHKAITISFSLTGVSYTQDYGMSTPLAQLAAPFWPGTHEPWAGTGGAGSARPVGGLISSTGELNLRYVAGVSSSGTLTSAVYAGTSYVVQ